MLLFSANLKGGFVMLTSRRFKAMAVFTTLVVLLIGAVVSYADTAGGYITSPTTMSALQGETPTVHTAMRLRITVHTGFL